MALDDIALRMKKLGFTTYEAKAYVSLLQYHPATRYELSKNSGVPRSAIYDVIRKLEAMGAVNGLYSEPQKYMPLPPEQLFDLLERQFRESVEDVRKFMKKFETAIEPGHLWNIVGYENMIHKAREMVEKAKNTVFLSIWNREARLLRDEIEQARNRGVKVTLFSFTSLPFDADCVYSYNLPEEKLKRIWDHKIIMVVDHNELLMGEADNKMPKKTAWTQNTAIVDIATNHIILDITLFGMRNGIDVSETVNEMQKGDTDQLQVLLSKAEAVTM